MGVLEADNVFCIPRSAIDAVIQLGVERCPFEQMISDRVG